MRKNLMTSVSFTVQDDLISQSSLNNTRLTAFHGLKPFSKQYNKNNWDETPIEPKNIRQIKQKAQRDAYRQLNQQVYNPFEHKLNQGFIPSQINLYNRQKQRQIQLIKQKQENMMNSSKNYTIVFHQQKQDNKIFQIAANNMLNQDKNIQDYYQRKFGKKIQHIKQQDQIQQQSNKINVKRDNFVKNIPKSQKIQSRKVISQGNKKKQQNAKINQQKKQIEKKQKKQNFQKIKKSVQQINIKNNQSIQKYQKQIQNKTNKKIQQIKTTKNQQQNLIDKKQIYSNNNNNNNNNNKNNNNHKNNNNIVKQKIKKQDKKKSYAQVYQGPDRNLVQQLQKQLTECPTITFDQIAELDNAKNLLQQAVLLPRLMPQFFQGIRRATRGILLFGPPGTGKTLLAKAIANNNIFFNVSASSLASKWKGQSQKMVRLLFQMAKYHAPSVIFFDQIDCIGSKRSENEHQSARKVKTQLLVQMDGVGSAENQVFVLAATNRPWDLDQALRRRLQKRIYISLPGKEGRKQMFEINLKGVKIQQKINWEKIIQQTKGCSGADICNICRDAAYMPMRRKLQQVGGVAKLATLKHEDLISQAITQKDLLQSAKKIKPSVGNQDLKKYSQWMKQFGSS